MGTLPGPAEDQREATLTHLESLFGVVPGQDTDVATGATQRVRAMLASGLMSIGAHARTHRPLPALSEAEQASEISGSMEDCRDLTGVAPTCFAYPHGEVAEICTATGRACRVAISRAPPSEELLPRAQSSTAAKVSVGDLEVMLFERWLRSVGCIDDAGGGGPP